MRLIDGIKRDVEVKWGKNLDQRSALSSLFTLSTLSGEHGMHGHYRLWRGRGTDERNIKEIVSILSFGMRLVGGRP